MENFKVPNFELVADILYWFVIRYEPDSYIQYEIDQEQDRVVFIKSTVQMFASKARIKLNPKRLYQADGYAVKEMLKIASMLNKAMKISANEEEDMGTTELQSKLGNLKQAKALATEILGFTDTGAKLYDSLSKEKELRDARTKALDFLDTMGNGQEYIEKCVRDLMSGQDSQIEQMKEMVGKLQQSEAQLQSKIERRGAELDRAKKRLQGIASVRPEHLDERHQYEKLEAELEKFYQMYIDKFKNLDYLENQLDLWNTSEQKKREESEGALQKIQNKFQQEEYKDQRDGGDQEVNHGAMGSTRTGFNVQGALDDDDDDDDEGEEVGASDLSEDDDGEALMVGSEDEDGLEEDGDEIEEDEEGDDHNF